MKALVTTHRRTERVFLVGVELVQQQRWNVSDSLAELAELTETAGGQVVGEGRQRLNAPVAATFIGPGKAASFASYCQEADIDTVIFDDELTGAQTRNLERIFRLKVLDRTALILDIFGQRARTREGKLQVELAQLQHLLPRLTRFWSHLSRQKGGIGMRGGEGETQLEADRRRLQERIEKIERELLTVRRQRTTQREGRQRRRWALASIVGYTNAGKSTLFTSLTGTVVLAEDKLFATLDPTTRRLRLPTNQNVLISDTVGFIRKLPHQLVEAFKATLEEVVEADLLLHVVDAAHPRAEEQISSVDDVLKEIGAHEKPTLMVFNKMDLPEARAVSARHRDLHPNAVFLSARSGEGVPVLLETLGTMLRPIRDVLELAIPHEAGAALARLHEVGQIVSIQYADTVTRVIARVPPHYRLEFEPFIEDNTTARFS